MSSLAKAAQNTAWSALSRITQLAVGFGSMPVLFRYFGKEDFGLITLAMSVHTYLMLMAFGTPSGMVRNAAAWISLGQWDQLSKAARTSFSFYGLIGLANLAIFGAMATVGLGGFNLPEGKSELLSAILLSAGVAAVIYWPFTLLDQLLAAQEEIHFLARLEFLQTAFRIFSIIITLALGLNVVAFFILQLVGMNLGVPFKMLRWRRYMSLRRTLVPGWFWPEFKGVLQLGGWMFLLGLASMSAMHLRPFILSTRAENGIALCAEYEILQALTGILLALGTMVQYVLVPVAAKAIARDDRDTLDSITYEATRTYWAVLALPLFGLAACAEPFLTLYVGAENAFLGRWLVILLFSMVGIYMQPVTAIVVARGNLRSLVAFGFFSAALSLLLSWMLVPAMGLGGVVWATVAYHISQFLFYHFLYLPRVMGISPGRLLVHTFLPPMLVGTVMAASMLGLWQALPWQSPIARLSAGIPFGAAIYVILTLSFVIKPAQARKLFLAVIGRRGEVQSPAVSREP